MLKVFILHGHVSNTGGVANFYKSIAKEFDKEKFSIKHVRNGRIEKYHLLKFLPFRLIDIAFNYLYFSCLFLLYRPSIIHLNPSIDKKSIFRDYVYVSIAKLLSKQVGVVTHIHGWNSAILRKNDRLSKTLRKFLLKSNHIIVLAEIFKAELLQHNVEKNKISVIPTAVNSKLYPNRDFVSLYSEIKPFQILFLSRILEEKGIFILIDAINKITSLNLNEPLKFVIAGEGEDRIQLAAKIEEFNLNDIISLPGYVRDDKKVNLLLQSDIFIFPSFYGEGCPVAVLEAMAAGLPLITTRVGALGEIIEEKVNGLFIEKKNSDQIVDSVLLLLNDKLLVKNMSIKNQTTARKEFDVKVITKKIESIYIQLSKV